MQYAWVTRKAYRILVGKSEGKRPLGRPSRRYNIGMYLRETGWESVDWILRAQNLVNKVMNLRVP
jgi:hypothetical protein